MTQPTTTDYDERKHRDEVDAAFTSGEFSVYSGWIIETVNGCTCGTGGLPAHELGCGAMPIFDLAGHLHADTVAAEKAIYDRYRVLGTAEIVAALAADPEPWVLRSNPGVRFSDTQKAALPGLDVTHSPRPEYEIGSNPLLREFIAGSETISEVTERLSGVATSEQIAHAHPILVKATHIAAAYFVPAFSPESDFA